MTSQLFQFNGSANYSSSSSSEEGQLDLGRVAAALKRGQWLIVGTTLAATAAAVARVVLSPPTYEAAFEILIQPSSAETEVVSSVSDFSSNQTQRTISLKDQVRILTSPGVLAPVVDEVLSTYPDLCQPSDPDESGDPNDLSEPSESGNPSGGAAVIAPLTPEELRQQCGYATIANLLTVELLEERSSRNEGSRIFRATYETDSEVFAQYAAEVIAQAYLDYGLESRQRDIRQALSFLQSKLPDLRGRVNRLQGQLQTLRQANDLINPEARGSQLTQQITRAKQDYAAVQVELKETLTLAESLQQQLDQQPRDAVASPYLSNSPRYRTLIQELLALDTEITQAAPLFLDNSPDMEVLQDRREHLLKLLAREGQQAQQELLVQLEGLQSREEALADTLNSLRRDVHELALLSRNYSDIDRELAIATDNLSQLLQKQEILQIEAAQRELPWELITPPVVRTQTASLPRNGAMGVVLGLLLGIGVALTRDTLKDTLHTPNDIKRVTTLPILGLIPHYDLVSGALQAPLSRRRQEPVLVLAGERQLEKPQETVVYSNGNAPPRDLTAFREAFRSLMANIRRIETEKPLRSVVVSSASPQEGKSTTAAYLAQAAAAMGERVLLVDGDLRSPSLHEFMGISNQRGWANYLTREARLRNIVRKSPNEPNLYLLSAGKLADDAARVLSTKPIRHFLQRVETVVDLVIFDSPAVLDYADASLIAAETNGMVLVSKLGKLKSTQLEQTLEKLWISKIAVLGIVAREEY